MVCPTCGRVVTEETTVCPVCGTKLNEEKKAGSGGTVEPAIVVYFLIFAAALAWLMPVAAIPVAIVGLVAAWFSGKLRKVGCILFLIFLSVGVFNLATGAHKNFFSASALQEKFAFFHEKEDGAAEKEKQGKNQEKKQVDSINWSAKPHGNLEIRKESGELVLTVEDLEDVSMGLQKDSTTGSEQAVVALTFNEHGAKLFEEATTYAMQNDQTLLIYVDEELVSSPRVMTPITDGRCVITGLKDSEEAKKIAGLIQG
jgi:rRNA maturation endonuclease Nob1